jgi:hypothetical protein
MRLRYIWATLPVLSSSGANRSDRINESAKLANVCLWHEASVRKCALVRTLVGLSGHRGRVLDL